MNRLQPGVFHRMELRPCPDHGIGCPLKADVGVATRADERDLRCLGVQDRETAHEWLSNCAGHSDDMMTLRGFVPDEYLQLSRLDDRQVVEELATMVARRTLCLIVAVTRPTTVPPAGPPPFLPEVRGRTPSYYQPPVTEMQPSATAELEDLAAIADQAMQAATLVAAARDGTPFCEVCEKARQQQAAMEAGTR